MADESVKKLLIKLGISTKDWKTAVDDIKSKLNEVNTQARKDAEAMKATQKEQIDLTKQQIADQQRLTAEARSMAAVDKAKSAWEERNQAALRTTLQRRILETAELKKQQVEQAGAVRLEQEQLKLAEQRLRLTEQQITLQQRQAKAAQGTGGDGGGGIFGTLAGALGGGLVGNVAAGAGIGTIIGEGAVKLIDMASEKMHSLTEALMEAMGPAVQLREQFEKLALRAGVGPDEYLNKLRAATRGLADDTSLYRIANNYMQQGLKVSTDDIARLIKATVDLARAQGKDATTAMTALERASKTGRTQVLAMVTGLTRQELALKGVSQAVDATTRNTMQFNQVLAALEAREKAIGTPAATLPELFQQWRVAQKDLTEEMAGTISRSVGFQNAIKSISELMIKLVPLVSELANWIGTKLGDAFELVNPIIKLTESSVHLLMAAVHEFTNLIPGLGKAVDKLPIQLSSFRQWIASVGMGFRTLAEYVEETAVKMEYGSQIFNAVIHRNFDEAKKLYQEMQQELAAGKMDYAKDIIGLAQFGSGTGKTKVSPAGKQQDIDSNVASAKMIQKLELEIAQQTAKLRLEMTMERLKAEEAAAKEAYDAGLISLKQEIDRERAIYTAEHKAKLQMIEDERKAKLTETIEAGKASGLPANILAKQEAVVNLQFKNQKESEQVAFNQKIFALDKQLLDDQESAYRIYVNGINEINKKGVDERITVLEKEFQQGRIGIEDYMSQRKMLIQEEYDLTVQGLNNKLTAAKKNSAEEATINVALIQAQVDREKKLTALELSEGELRVKNLENNYNQAKKYLDVVTATAAQSKGSGAAAEQQFATEALLALTQDRLRQLQIQQSNLNPAVHGFSEEWVQIQEQIAGAVEEEQKLNQKLVEAKDIAGPLAGIFGEIGGLFEKFGGPTSRGIASVLQNMEGAFGQLSKFSTGMAQAGGPSGLFGGLAQSFTALFKPQTITTNVKATAQQIFDQGLQKSSGTMDRMSEVTLRATTRLDALAQAAENAAKGLEGKAAAGAAGTGSGGPEAPTTGGTKGTYEFGTNYVPETGTYMLHEGEAVTPADDLAEGGGSPGGGIASVVSGVTESLTNFKSYLDDTTKVPFAQTLQTFAKGLGTVMNGLMSAVSSVTGGKTAGGGAVSGALGMGGLGMQVGAMAGPMGSLIGGAAGLVTGGILGGIFGGKEQQLMVTLNTIKNQMQGIMESLNQGTISLSQAIQDLRQERQQALAMLSHNSKGGKGGGKGKKGSTGQLSQAQAAIQAIDQQIQQLVNEQQQILDQLNQSLLQLSQPLAFQTYLSSLDEIIQKYQTFASAAAGNAQEVANAQLFLNDSLNQYVQTLSQQLNQAQQQAIQDALTLLNLEYQRQQIINQEAQQEYDILTQGVVARQRTTAMTKGQEIGQLRYQRDMQLEQINEQISLQQYKVDSETKIFGLATTRIGLETELLAAQEQAYDVQNAQTAALAQVLTDLQQGMASGTLMQTIENLYKGGNLPTGTGLLTTLLQQLGLGGNIPPGTQSGPGGAQNLLEEVPQQFQSAASFMNSLDPSFLTSLQAALETQAGSPQRQALVSEVGQYASQGTAEGYDMSGLSGFIESGTGQPVSGPPSGGGGAQKPIGGGTGGGQRPSGGSGGGGFSPNHPLLRAASYISSYKAPSMQFPSGSMPAMDTGSSRIATETQLVSMTATRTTAEMKVISARQDQITLEMSFLAALNDTVDRINNMGSGSSSGSSFEGLLQKVYETRGRYGSGNMRREVL